MIFTKAPTTVTGPFDDILVDRAVTQQVDWEVELGAIIGKTGRNISKSDALNHVFGYTVINDVTARDLQQQHVQWFKGKSLDGFCPMGPVVVTADEFGDPQTKQVQLRVNGVTKQDASTANMIFAVDVIIEWLSKGTHARSRRHHRDRNTGRRRHGTHASGVSAERRRARNGSRRHRDAAQSNQRRHMIRQPLISDENAAIREVIENWVLWRDAGDWDRFATVWHDDGWMTATWFQGPARKFIEVSREGFERGVSILHFLGGFTCDVAGYRAISQTKMTINQRATVEGALVDVVCTGRFYDFLEKRSERWGIVRRQPIYEKDRMDPVDPAATADARCGTPRDSFPRAIVTSRICSRRTGSRSRTTCQVCAARPSRRSMRKGVRGSPARRRQASRCKASLHDPPLTH